MSTGTCGPFRWRSFVPPQDAVVWSMNRMLSSWRLTWPAKNLPNRTHMERDHLPPVREEPEEIDTLKMDEIQVKSYVGGLVKSFERKAA